MICILPSKGRASHCSGGVAAAYSKVGVIGNGQWMPFDCTMNPTNAAIATRPCLISACRRKA